MSRDIGLTHGAGKGDKPRHTHNSRWVENYEAIDWGRNKAPKAPPEPPPPSPEPEPNPDWNDAKLYSPT